MKNNSAEYYQELPNGECSIVCFVSRSCAGHEGVGPSYPREEEEEGSEGCTMGTGHIPVHGASAVHAHQRIVSKGPRAHGAKPELASHCTHPQVHLCKGKVWWYAHVVNAVYS